MKSCTISLVYTSATCHCISVGEECRAIDRVALAKQGDNGLGSVRPSLCLFVRALLFEPFDLWPWFLVWGRPWHRLSWDCRSKVKVVFWHHCYLALRSRSNVRSRSGSRSRVNVRGQSQISCSQRSILGARLCRVQQRAQKSYYPRCKVFVCVSLLIHKRPNALYGGSSFVLQQVTHILFHLRSWWGQGANKKIKCGVGVINLSSRHIN